MSDQDYSPDDYRKATSAWAEVVKDFTRAQLIQTMIDYRSLTSPAYEAASNQLTQLNRNEERRQARQEELDIWADMSEKDVKRLGKRHHKSKIWVSKLLKYKGKKEAKMVKQGKVPLTTIKGLRRAA